MGVCAGSSIVESVFLLMVCRPALVCRALAFLPNFLSFPVLGRDGKLVWVKISKIAGAPEHIRIIAQRILT